MYQNPIGVKYRYFGTLARLQGVKRSSKIRDCSLYIIQKNTNFSISKFLLCFKLKQKSTYISTEWRLLSAEWATKQNCIKFRMYSWYCIIHLKKLYKYFEYYISKILRALWLVNLAGRTLLHGPLTFKVLFCCQTVAWFIAKFSQLMKQITV